MGRGHGNRRAVWLQTAVGTRKETETRRVWGKGWEDRPRASTHSTVPMVTAPACWERMQLLDLRPAVLCWCVISVTNIYSKLVQPCSPWARTALNAAQGKFVTFLNT